MRRSVELEPLSPVHIGSQDRLSNMDYIVRGNRFYRLDIDKILTLIVNDDVLLNKLRNGRIGEIVDRLGVDKVTLYTLSTYLDGYNKEVYPFIKYGSDVYLPGSSIKGAIRSAILYSRLKSDRRYLENHIKKLNIERSKLNRESKEREKIKRLKSLIKSAARDLEDGIFRDNSKDMHRDMLRFLNVGDMYPFSSEIGDVLELSEIAILPTNLRLAMETLKVGARFSGYIDSDGGRGISIDEVKRCCRIFANDIIEYELNNIEKYRKYECSIKDFYNKLKDINNKRILIRVGRQGHYSITIGILLYDRLKEYNIGWLVREPINRKVYIGKEVMPLGWVGVDIG